jgi:type VI secretion system protein ImpJ
MGKLPHAVMWREGMLMSPQHLQQQDLHHTHVREMRLNSIAPNAWGVAHMHLDDAALGEGKIVVNALRATFPSGTHVALDSLTWDATAAGQPLTRPIGEALAPGQVSMPVYVGLAQLQEGAANVAVDTVAMPQHRYVGQHRRVAELTHAATPAVDVSFMVPNLQILFGSELGEHVESIRIGEVVRDARGTLRWLGTHVPPCLHIGSAAYLQGRLEALLALATGRQRQLAMLCRNIRASGQALQMNALLQFRQRDALRAALPWLHDLVVTPHTSPQMAYLMLKQVIGHLAALSDELDIPLLPALQHLDLRQGFSAAFAAIESLLGADKQRVPVTFSLKPTNQGYYASTDLEADFDAKATWLITLRGAGTEVEQARRWTHFARLAAVADMPHLVQAAVVGVPLVHLNTPPPDIAWDPETLYFAVDTDHHHWRRIAQDKTLAMAPPPGVLVDTNLKLELLMLEQG